MMPFRPRAPPGWDSKVRAEFGAADKENPIDRLEYISNPFSVKHYLLIQSFAADPEQQCDSEHASQTNEDSLPSSDAHGRHPV
jgi:hypothetical protein